MFAMSFKLTLQHRFDHELVEEMAFRIPRQRPSYYLAINKVAYLSTTPSRSVIDLYSGKIPLKHFSEGYRT